MAKAPVPQNKGVQRVQPQQQKPKEIVKQPTPELPEHLKGQAIQGLEEVSRFVTPPYLKIVQKQSDDALIDTFGKGTTLWMPDRSVVAQVNEVFHFIPLFFYTEYCTWTPIEFRGQIPAIIERTADKKSRLALKATNSKTWDETLPNFRGIENLKVRHVEHLVFVVTLLGDHEMAGKPVTMSFSKGEHKTGRFLCDLIKKRKSSIYNCVFQAQVSSEPRSNNKGSWHGYDIDNPDPTGDISPWCDAEQSEAYKKVHEEVAEFFAGGILRAQFEDPEDVADAAATPAVGGPDAY